MKVKGGENMAFTTWTYCIIFNDGVRSQGTFGASSYAEAYAKAESMARASASSHKGVANIIVSER